MFFLVLLSWIAAGLVVGLIVNKVVNLRGDDPKLSLGAAAIGAFVAGIIYAVASGAGVSAWSWWGLLWAAVGGLVTVVVWHIVRSRSISHELYRPRQSY